MNNNDLTKNEANEDYSDKEDFILHEQLRNNGVAYAVDLGSLSTRNSESASGRRESKTADQDLNCEKLVMKLDAKVKIEAIECEDFDDCNSIEIDHNSDIDSFESFDDDSLVSKSLNDEIEETEVNEEEFVEFEDDQLSLPEEDWDAYEAASGRRESSESQGKRKITTDGPSFEKNEIGFGEMMGLDENLTLEEVFEVLKKKETIKSIEKGRFSRIVRSISNDLSESVIYRYSSKAMEALQLATENLLINLFLLADSDICNINSFQKSLKRIRKKMQYPSYCYGTDSIGKKRTWDLLVDNHKRNLDRKKKKEMHSGINCFNKYYSRVPDEDLHWINDEVSDNENANNTEEESKVDNANDIE